MNERTNVMETKVEFKAERLICCDCGQPFIFSAGERAFFWSKGLSTPKRCPQCRQKRRDTLVPDNGAEVVR
jgi:hypothetical protein